MRRVSRSVLGAAVLCGAVLVTPAGAAPVGSGDASAYGARIDLAGQNVITEPQAESDLAGADASETVVDVPAPPLAVSGTLTAQAAVHVQSDIATELVVESQAVAGPYNARGFAEIEGAEVLLDVPAEGVSLLRADAVRAEAVAVCSNGVVRYSAQSEIVNLDVGGTDIPLNGPVQDLIDTINDLLEDTGLAQVVNVQRNVVTVTDDGASVDALRVTVLSALGADPLGTVILGHAEVDAVDCGEPPECSDTEDNDGDGVIDAQDPGCHTDGQAGNPDTYDPNDDDETDPAAPPAGPAGESPNRQLPRTGVDSGLGLALLAGLGGLTALGLARRRAAA